MQPQLKGPNNDQKFNPAERQEQDLTNFEKNFGNRPTLNEGIASKEGAADQARSRLGNDLNKAENATAQNASSQPTSEAASQNIANSEQSPRPWYRPSRARKVSQKGLARYLRNKWVIGGIIGLISGIFVVSTTVPSLMLVHLKEVASRWIDKNGLNSNSRRQKKIMRQRWFSPDSNCKSGVKCRYKGGVSEDELKKMKESGLDPETEKVGDKTRIKSLASVDAQGKPIRLGLNDFEAHFDSDPRFRDRINFVMDPRASLNLGKFSTRIWAKVGASKRKFSEKSDPKEIEKDFRKTIYGGEGGDIGTKSPDCEKGASGCNETPEQQRQREAIERQLGDAYDEVKNGAAKVRADLEASDYANPPSVNPDLTDIDIEPSKAGSIVGKAIKSVPGTLLKGVYAIGEKLCGFYQLIRTLSIGAKVMKMFGLIKYALTLFAVYDSIKAGDGAAPLIAFTAGSLLRPSVEEGSKGKTFFDGPFLGLMTEGKVNDRKSLGRYVAGDAPLRLIDGVYNIINKNGISANACRHINSWYGQLFGLTTGILTLIFTGGSVNVGAIAVNTTLSVMFSVFSAYMIPLLIQYVAGTVSPDSKDPQGGFGISSALTAGLGFFRHERSKSTGDRPLMKKESAMIEREANEEMARAERAENLGKNPFSPDAPNSITNNLAFAIAPYVLAPTAQANYQNIASLITSPLNMVASSFGKIVAPSVNAQASTDGYGGDFCADRDAAKLDMAVDAMCVPVDGEGAKVLEAPKYEPQKVVDYMLQNGHIDDAGELKSDDYKKFTDDCIEGVAPITSDGYGVDVTEDVDTRKCLIRDSKTLGYSSQIKTASTSKNDVSLADAASDAEAEKITMFRLYRKDTGIDQDLNASVKGELGNEDTGVTNTPQQTGPLNPGAFVWPVVPSGISKISSCMNQTDPSYRLHSGLDIAAPLGSTIVAVADGQVVFEGKNVGGFEYYIAIKHANGSITGYGHNQDNLVKEGDTVKQGQPIAKVGSRGESTGPHVHINYIPDGSSVFTTKANAANPLFNNLMPKPADVVDAAGCMTPQKLKAR